MACFRLLHDDDDCFFGTRTPVVCFALLLLTDITALEQRDVTPSNKPKQSGCVSVFSPFVLLVTVPRRDNINLIHLWNCISKCTVAVSYEGVNLKDNYGEERSCRQGKRRKGVVKRCGKDFISVKLPGCFSDTLVRWQPVRWQDYMFAVALTDVPRWWNNNAWDPLLLYPLPSIPFSLGRW